MFSTSTKDFLENLMEDFKPKNAETNFSKNESNQHWNRFFGKKDYQNLDASIKQKKCHSVQILRVSIFRLRRKSTGPNFNRNIWNFGLVRFLLEIVLKYIVFIQIFLWKCKLFDSDPDGWKQTRRYGDIMFWVWRRTKSKKTSFRKVGFSSVWCKLQKNELSIDSSSSIVNLPVEKEISRKNFCKFFSEVFGL